MIAQVGYIPPEIFGVFLHERTQARTQALPHAEKFKRQSQSPIAAGTKKNHFCSFVIGPGKRRSEEGR